MIWQTSAVDREESEDGTQCDHDDHHDRDHGVNLLRVQNTRRKAELVEHTGSLPNDKQRHTLVHYLREGIPEPWSRAGDTLVHYVREGIPEPWSRAGETH